MAGFRYILHLTLSMYILKGKAQQKIPSCRTLKGLKLKQFVNANNFFGVVVVATIFLRLL